MFLLFFGGGRDMLNIHEHPSSILFVLKKKVLIFWFLVAKLILETDFFGGG